MRQAEVINSIKHPAVAAARQALGHGGEKPRAYVVEGPGMVAQALAARAPIQAVFSLPREQLETEEREVLTAVQQTEHPWHFVSRGVLFRLLGVGYETAVRQLAVIEGTPYTLETALPLITNESVLVVGERIQDPRNVGVLIRVADAVSHSLALFTNDSADPFSRPSVRSTTGSLLRVPIMLADDLPAALHHLRHHGVRVIGSSAQAAQAVYEVRFSRPCALVVGNETTGLSQEAAQQCETMVRIPMSGGAHSYNVTVAAGVLVYELMRQEGMS